MRIAHLLRKYNPAEWGGTETALQRLFEALRPQGVASVAYAPRLKTRTPPRDPLAEAGCTLKRYRACVPVLGPSRAQKDQMLAVGGNLMSFHLLFSLLRERNLDVIHSHALGRVGGIGLTVAKRRNLPFVVTIHGGVLAIPDSLRQSFQQPGIRGWEWGKLFGALLNSRRVFLDADAILTCNRSEADLLRQQYPGKRIEVQPHGIPLAAFQADQRDAALAAFPRSRARKVLLVSGRIDPIKNQLWVVGRLPAIIQRFPDVLLVLAGPCTDAAYGERLAREVRERNLTSHVLLTGGLPPGDPRLIGLFQTASVVLQPSLSETFGLIVLEAWAARVPVIASRTPGASALIRHRQNGWLFGFEDPAAFNDAVGEALHSPETTAAYAAAGHRLAASEYDSRVLATRLKNLYEELRDTKRRGLSQPSPPGAAIEKAQLASP